MLRAPFEGFVDTEAGPTFLRVRGDGPAALVFHGGPGFDHEPLLAGLAEAMKHRTLVFFDQLGCGATPAPDGPVTAAASYAHAAALLDALGPEPIGMIAHSWGTVAAAGAISLRPDFAFTESLLVSPVAIDSGGYDKARAAITGRVPPSVLHNMLALLNAGADGAAAFALLMPYYVASPDTVLPPIGIAAQTYFSVDASLQAFDLTGVVDRFGPISVIRGDSDYVDPSTIVALREGARNDIVLDEVGHYPFFEATDAFNHAIGRVYA